MARVCLLLIILVAVALGGLGGSALAATADADVGAPCGGLQVRGGVVSLGRALPVSASVADDAGACLDAIARTLAARPEVRSVTVAARVGGDAQARHFALGVAKVVAEALAARGLDRSRISTVVPAVRPGEADNIQIAYVERRSFRPVAQVWALSGRAWSGGRLGALAPAAAGALVTPRQYFETGAGSVAVLMLVDGSHVRVAAESVIRIGDITLGADRRRDVRIEVLRGDAAVFTSTMPGPFRLVTGNAIAGARGTVFRLALPDADVTRLETLAGTVNLAGDRGQTFVTRGEGSRVDYSGYPERPRPLLVAPRIVRPVLGDRRLGDPLEWRAVPHAARYRVEFARDAQLTEAYWATETGYVRAVVGEALTPGKWFWRVTAIDADGFVGFPSKVYAFTVRP